MKCERASEWFSDLIDESIQPAKRVVLEAHLSECADCATAVERLRSDWAALGQMPSLTPPVTLRAAIWQRIDSPASYASKTQSSRPRPRLPMWARAGVAVVGAAALLALASVSVPGRFRTAGWTSWIPGIERPSDQMLVSGSAVRIESSGPDAREPQAVQVRLRVVSPEPIQAQVSLIDAGEVVARAAATLSAPTTRIILVPPSSASGPLEARLEWRSSRGEPSSLVLPVR